MRSSEILGSIVREFPDRGAQWLLESSENARGFLLEVAGDIASRLDFSRVEHIPTRFIPDDLRKLEADILFRIPYHALDGPAEQEVFIYILIEHQSRHDPSMGFRLLLYMVNIWDRQRRQWLARDVPVDQWRFLPILPIVFYTGSEKWETPLSVKTLMDLPGEMEQFIPAFDALLLRLKETSPEELTKSGHPFGYLLRVMQKEDAAEGALAEAIENAVDYLAGMAEDQQEAWEKAIYYLYLLVHHRRNPEEGERLKEKIAERVSANRGRKAGEEMAETLAQQLMEQGEKRGILKGIVQEKQEALLRLMAEKFGPAPAETARRVRRLRSTATLDQLLIRVLHANSLEEMGI
ncbi:MAG: Rpn family recombination-promoting nuclease/putative transposase [Chloroflexi bacterium]|nr:Rpn family recombination-promoting nuclease/putative transposase [Chloroflexota bacterium]